MTAIETRPDVVEARTRYQSAGTSGQDGTYQRASACQSTRPTGASSPSSPAATAVVGKSKLRLLHQVVIRSAPAAGVAERV